MITCKNLSIFTKISVHIVCGHAYPHHILPKRLVTKKSNKAEKINIIAIKWKYIKERH